MFKKAILAVALWCAGASAALSQSWYLSDVNYNAGPLNCWPAGGLFLDWQPRSGSQDGVVKYQTRDSSFVAILDWTKPRYIAEAGVIYFEMTGSVLRGSGRIPRIWAQRAYHLPDGGVTNFRGFEQASVGGATGKTANVAAQLGPSGSYDGVTVRITFTDGGSCNEPVLADYVFRKG